MTDDHTYIRKIIFSFLLILLLVGIVYVGTSFFLFNKYFQETTQKLNANVAQHLIDEKFKGDSPFLENGAVNTKLFGDVMHDMMAVNRGIEVYLLNTEGEVLYSVVLDHSKASKEPKVVDLVPVKAFIESKGSKFILGTDPRNLDVEKVFSAAEYDVNGKKGFVYVVLASKVYDDITGGLLTSYFAKMGMGITVLSMLFAVFISNFAVRTLSKNLKELIFVVKQFRDGDLTARLKVTKNTNLKTVALTFNEMADKIVSNINEIKSVDRFRQELIANVSHDLRSPLAVIQGYTETLVVKNDVLEEKEKKEYLDIILSSAAQLNRLVMQLFEYSKFEANQIIPKKEPFILAELVSDMYSRYNLLAEKKGIKISIDVGPKIPLVFADIGLIEQAFQNVLTNAIQYTQENGQISLRIKAMKEVVVFQVQDSGPGIAIEDQELIFERYKMSPNNPTPQVGSGLGLSITKKIMDLHKGAVKVISQPSVGSTFEFYFPVP